MSLLSVGPLYAGVLISLLLEKTVFVLKSQLSPPVRQLPPIALALKYGEASIMAPDKSQIVTPLYPQTVPTPLLQQKAVFQSTPIPNCTFKSTNAAGSRPSLPLASKCVSTTKSTKPKAGIFAPLWLYCKDLVPFLVSTNPSPFPSLTFFGAKPTLFLKYSVPKESPPPQVKALQTIEPAEVPASTIQFLTALALITESNALGLASSLSQLLTCLPWSPPLKKMISAVCKIARLACPCGVEMSPWI